MSEGTLVRFDAARRALSEARSIDEVKDVRDQAEAIRLYAKQQGESLQMQNDVAEIKLRAERRLGELLSETVHPGNPQLSRDATIGRLPDGITKDQSSRWQQVADIPEDTFEQHIAETKATRDELTTAGLLRLAKQQRQEDEVALKEMADNLPAAFHAPDAGKWTSTLYGFFRALNTLASMPSAAEVVAHIQVWEVGQVEPLPAARVWLEDFAESWREAHGE
jgi:hypothetical protein